jgi:hypothetical protein
LEIFAPIKITRLALTGFEPPSLVALRQGKLAVDDFTIHWKASDNDKTFWQAKSGVRLNPRNILRPLRLIVVIEA